MTAKQRKGIVIHWSVLLLSLICAVAGVYGLAAGVRSASVGAVVAGVLGFALHVYFTGKLRKMED